MAESVSGRELRRAAVAAGSGALRLDRFVSQAFQLGRSAAQDAIKAGFVSVNGRVVRRAAHSLSGGSDVELWSKPTDLVPEPDAPLDIRLETPDYVVAYKPSGVPSAPLDTLERGSLCGALVGRYPEMRGVGYAAREPGLLHRLDTGTSGLVLAARSKNAFDKLRQFQAQGQLEKSYLAVIRGRPAEDSGEISEPLGPDPRRSGRVMVGGGYEAYTQYQVLESHGETSLVELRVQRAYRHQIRVHLAWLGYPLYGDALYGAGERRRARSNVEAVAASPGTAEPAAPGASVERPRLALHASRLCLSAAPPYRFDIQADLPQELRALLSEA